MSERRQYQPFGLAEATLATYRELPGGGAGAVVFLGCPIQGFRWVPEVTEVLSAATGDTARRAYPVAEEHTLDLERTGVFRTATGAPARLVATDRYVFEVEWTVRCPGAVLRYGLRFHGVTWRSAPLGSVGFHAFEQPQRLRAERVEDYIPS
jgi:hypothetical protein